MTRKVLRIAIIAIFWSFPRAISPLFSRHLLLLVYACPHVKDLILATVHFNILVHMWHRIQTIVCFGDMLVHMWKILQIATVHYCSVRAPVTVSPASCRRPSAPGGTIDDVEKKIHTQKRIQCSKNHSAMDIQIISYCITACNCGLRRIESIRL